LMALVQESPMDFSRAYISAFRLLAKTGIVY